MKILSTKYDFQIIQNKLINEQVEDEKVKSKLLSNQITVSNQSNKDL